MPTRNERREENQRQFQRLNQRLHDVVESQVPDATTVPFLCECADGRCRGTLTSHPDNGKRSLSAPTTSSSSPATPARRAKRSWTRWVHTRSSRRRRASSFADPRRSAGRAQDTSETFRPAGVLAFRPSSGATTARGSLRGERWPSSSVGAKPAMCRGSTCGLLPGGATSVR
jgi:hypothetical protein